MKLLGDTQGIAALKELHADNKTYLKFLVGEAKSNTDLTAPFTAKSGEKYNLKVDPRSGDLLVEAAD